VIFVSANVSFARSAQAVAARAGALTNSGIAAATAVATDESKGSGRFMVLIPPGDVKKHRGFRADLSRVLPRTDAT
jgi:hypothetical protein